MRSKSGIFRVFIILSLVAAVGLFGLSAGLGLDFDRLQKALISRFGPGQAGVFVEWQQMLVNGNAAADAEKLRRVNQFFNRNIAFDDDVLVWGQSDYWATPVETIGRGRGDCEDFAIAKYYSLINLGIPVSKLRLVYVRALQKGPAGQVLQAHMVVAYYANSEADALILDNLNGEILPAARRPDLDPIFSFNSTGLWQGTGKQSSRSNLSRWQNLQARARAEGFQ